MKFKLSDVNVTEIARVSKPAVAKATFAITKSDDNNDVLTFNVYHPIVKNEVKKQAFGPVLIPDEFDSQGHTISKEEIEKACHGFMINLAKGQVEGEGSSEDHKIFDKSCNVIECVIDRDGSIAKMYNVEVPTGSWWIGYQFDDTAWEKVEKGEITGFSIGGAGLHTPVDDTNILDLEKVQQSIVDKVIKGITDKFKTVTKGEGDPLSFTAAYTERVNEDKLWEIKSAFNRSLDSILSSDATNKEELVKASLNQYGIKLLSFIKATTTTTDDGVVALSKANLALAKVFEDGSNQLINKSTKGGNTLTPEEIKEMTKGIVTEVVKEVTPIIEKSKEDITKQMEEQFIKKGDNNHADVNDQKDVIVKGADGKEINLSVLSKNVTNVQELLKKIAATPNIPNGDDAPIGDDIHKGGENKFAGTAFSFSKR